MNNNEPIAYNVPTCCICLKPILTSILLRWKDNTPGQILLLNGMSISKNCICQGHTFVKCSTCGWMVPDDFHTPDDCTRLGNIVGKKKIEIPKAFYDAFNEEAQNEQ